MNNNYPWLRGLRKDWNVTRGKFLFRHQKRNAGELHEQYKRLALTLDGVVERSKVDADGLQPADYSTYQIFEKGNLVFKLIDLENKKTSRVGLAPSDGIMSPAYIRLEKTSESILEEFAHYYYLSLYYQDVYRDIGQGVRSSLGAADLLDLPVPTPALHEQKKIVEFLDKKLEKIKRLKGTMKQKLERLSEYQFVLIFEAVTKGLNPAADLKESGEALIGKVPKHWKLISLKLTAQFASGSGFPEALQGKTEGDFPFLKVSDLNIPDLTVERANNYVTRSEAAEHRFTIVPAGSIVMPKIGEAMRKNTRKMLARPSIIDNNMMAIIPRDTIDREFLFFWTMVLKTDFYINPGTVPSLNVFEYKNQKITLPPLDEQKKIASYLKEKLNYIKELTETIQKELTELDEYRASLVTDAVIGKIEIGEKMMKG